MLDRIRPSEIEDPAFAEYLAACEDYYKRQMLAHEHSPRARPGSRAGPKQFVDRNT
jgi:hypothetical protein